VAGFVHVCPRERHYWRFQGGTREQGGCRGDHYRSHRDPHQLAAV